MAKRSTRAQLQTSVASGAGFHHRSDVGGVVGVVVGQEDPSDVFRGHQSEDVVEPTGAVQRSAVDDHRLRAQDLTPALLTR